MRANSLNIWEGHTIASRDLLALSAGGVRTERARTSTNNVVGREIFDIFGETICGKGRGQKNPLLLLSVLVLIVFLQQHAIDLCSRIIAFLTLKKYFYSR